ncbi:MAG TPA: ABC transporter permease, partial [Chlorobaculum parvum]|nr:ABC transporter permease [Chlorobaculum parvum]
MKRFIAFIRKEFYHIVRDRRTAAILFGMPILQLLLFGYAIRNEVSEVKTGILDMSHDTVTEALTDKLFSSGTFIFAGTLQSEKDIAPAFAAGRMNEVVVFEPDFAGRLQKDGVAQMQALTDGSDPNVSRIVTGYTQAVVHNYLAEQADGSARQVGVEAVPLMMFNPSLKSVYLFVPGLMAMILMLVSTLMTSISITRE